MGHLGQVNPFSPSLVQQGSGGGGMSTALDPFPYGEYGSSPGIADWRSQVLSTKNGMARKNGTGTLDPGPMRERLGMCSAAMGYGGGPGYSNAPMVTPGAEGGVSRMNYYPMQRTQFESPHMGRMLPYVGPSRWPVRMGAGNGYGNSQVGRILLMGLVTAALVGGLLYFTGALTGGGRYGGMAGLGRARRRRPRRRRRRRRVSGAASRSSSSSASMGARRRRKSRKVRYPGNRKRRKCRSGKRKGKKKVRRRVRIKRGPRKGKYMHVWKCA